MEFQGGSIVRDHAIPSSRRGASAGWPGWGKCDGVARNHWVVDVLGEPQGKLLGGHHLLLRQGQEQLVVQEEVQGEVQRVGQREVQREVQPVGQGGLPHWHQWVLANSFEQTRGGRQGGRLGQRRVGQLVVELVGRQVEDPVLPWVGHPCLLPVLPWVGHPHLLAFQHGGRRSSDVEGCSFPFLQRGRIDHERCEWWLESQCGGGCRGEGSCRGGKKTWW